MQGTMQATTPADELQTRDKHELQTRDKQELAKVNAAFVAAVCKHHETKKTLQARVKALETDLLTAKQTCKDQEYHMQQVAAAGGATDPERAAWAKAKGELGAQNEGLRKRVRELEVVEKGWKQARAIFTTERTGWARSGA